MKIVIRADDKTVRSRAKRLGIEVVVTDSWEVTGPTLFASTKIPFDLVGAGFNFLERWDVAAPLWRYDKIAADIGTPADRKRTQAITRDLRLLLYAPELLFVRDSEAGRALVETWRAECAHGDERLAFIRALYIVKPIFCALPLSWLAEVQERSVAAGKSARASRRQNAGARYKGAGYGLVLVQVGPNQHVKCKPGDEEAVRKRFAKMKMNREERRRTKR